MGVEEFTPGGVTIEDACEMAARLVRAGLLDYLSLSQATSNTIETHLPTGTGRRPPTAASSDR
jgi:2,4-dienoyl-CoA reductase-like NADH-dependent reductase (Old Yellow Enzyme family)